MEEAAPPDVAESTLLIEQHPDSKWQRSMLLPWAQSQVSFLKDLVTLRNPRSRFSFLNYLHEQGRLDEFVNLATSIPYRLEFSDYLQWVARSMERVEVEYGRRCAEIHARRAAGGALRGFRLTMADDSTLDCRDLVVGVGRDPHVPAVFRGLPAERVIHSSAYHGRIAALDRSAEHRVVVVGGAQSAAEMLIAVQDDLPRSRATVVMRSIGFQAYETSPFVTELYYPSFVDQFFEAPPEYRRQLLEEMRRTNYSGLSHGLLERLYHTLYVQRLTGEPRTRVITMTDVMGARTEGGEIVLDLRDRKTGRDTPLACDVVLLGTGFERGLPALARRVAAALGRDTLPLSRVYRATIDEPGDGAVYLQGASEETHGIADSLLSIIAQRSHEIVNDILTRRQLAEDATRRAA
jgi:L-ornithine N5-oxygenase